MTDIVFNIAKGQVKEYAEQARDVGASALILVPLSAVEADGVLADYDDLGALIGAAGNTELTAGNWNRKTISGASITVTVDDTNDRVDIDVDDQSWDPGPTAGNDSVALLLCFDADTGAGTDANIIPLTKHGFAITADGSVVTAQVAAAGFFRAA